MGYDGRWIAAKGQRLDAVHHCDRCADFLVAGQGLVGS